MKEENSRKGMSGNEEVGVEDADTAVTKTSMTPRSEDMEESSIDKPKIIERSKLQECIQHLR